MKRTSASVADAQEVTYSPMIPGLRPYSVDGQVMSRAEKDSVRKVQELLECRNYSRLFPCLGVSAKGIDKWIRAILQENIFT